MAQTKMLFTTKAAAPKFNRINPLNGIKKMFSLRAIVELLKSLIKIVVLLYIVYTVLVDEVATLPALIDMNPMTAMMKTGGIIMDVVLKSGIAFIFLAAADYMYQWWDFEKNMKMSKQEIKDEYKNSEGDPHVKAALRQRRMQMLQRGAMDSVAEADFVVRNPTHVACALKYDAETMQSPTLTCKGTELIAKQIIEIAQKHNVPVIDNAPVARALFRMVDLNQQIPPELYKAVAEILLFVYGLKAKQNRNN